MTPADTPKQLSTLRVSLIVLACGLALTCVLHWILNPWAVRTQRQVHNIKAASQISADLQRYIRATGTLPRGVQQIDDEGYYRRLMPAVDADGSPLHFIVTDRELQIWSSGPDNAQRTQDDVLIFSEPHRFSYPIPISPQRQPEAPSSELEEGR